MPTAIWDKLYSWRAQCSAGYNSLIQAWIVKTLTDSVQNPQNIQLVNTDTGAGDTELLLSGEVAACLLLPVSSPASPASGCLNQINNLLVTFSFRTLLSFFIPLL